MITYLLRRLLYVLPTLILLSILCFTVITLPPGDYLTQLRAQLAESGDASDQFQLQYLEQRYGLGEPAYRQYILWISGWFRGDLGDSFQWNQPVTELIGERLLFTILIATSTLVFTWILALPIGIYSATHQYSIGDYLFTLIGFFGLSVPNFLLALVLMFIAVFVFNTSIGGLFSREYINAPWSMARVIDLLQHLWIPIIVIGTHDAASLIRILRSNLLDELGTQYIQTARAKGLSERVVIYKHAVRIAINPLISLLGMQFPRIVSGGAITSIVLSLPTLGPLLYSSILSRDTYLGGAILMLFGLALIAGNLVADVLLAWADPRIRYD